jgi:hypothetical protein
MCVHVFGVKICVVIHIFGCTSFLVRVPKACAKDASLFVFHFALRFGLRHAFNAMCVCM